jgi:hypothetical protein
LTHFSRPLRSGRIPLLRLTSYIALTTRLGIGCFFLQCQPSSSHRGIHGSACPWDLRFLALGLTSYIALTTRLGISRFFPTLAVSALVKPSRHRSACPQDLRFLALWVDVLRRPNDPIRHRSFLSNACGVSPHQAIEASFCFSSAAYHLRIYFSVFH